MYCEKCGNKLENDSKFCTACGTPIEGSVTNPNPVPPAPPQPAPVSPAAPQPNTMQARPAGQLSTNFGMAKLFFLGIVTFGIYPLIIYSKISSYINIIASRYDGRKTMHYCLVYFVFSWLTFGVLPIVWFHKLSNRIGAELRRRNIAYSFNAGTFWLWNVLGSLFFAGPFIYGHKLCTAMNLLCNDYNVRG